MVRNGFDDSCTKSDILALWESLKLALLTAGSVRSQVIAVWWESDVQFCKPYRKAISVLEMDISLKDSEIVKKDSEINQLAVSMTKK